MAGMVFPSYHTCSDDLTVRENIHDLPLSYKDIPAKPKRQSLLADALDRFQIVAGQDLSEPQPAIQGNSS